MDAIQKIRSFEKFGSILGLERMEKLMDKLGNPQDDLKYIHVAGTNGKGSVCRFVYEAIRESGYKVGIYTSPFVEIFNERIEFDGAYISDEDLQRCTDEVLAKVSEINEENSNLTEGNPSGTPTEFEIITAIAFVYFKSKKADYVVLEVGLGGRGDSTNIIKEPLVSVITSISFDHMDRLGNTIEKIAGEKAGIIKKGIDVVANTNSVDATKVMASKAETMDSKLYDLTDVRCENIKKTTESYIFDADIFGTKYSGIEITMLGEHQLQNALTALAAIDNLQKRNLISINNEGLRMGFKRAKQIARFEILKKNPYLIIDGAHNEGGAKALSQTMREHFAGKKTLLITGMLEDKDVKAILKHFYEITDDFIATEPENIRKISAKELKSEIVSAGKKCIALAEPALACEEALKLQDEYDVILFAGSLYLAGKVRSMINA